MEKLLSNNRVLYILLLIMLPLIVFWQTTSFKFVWDDERSHLTANRALMEDDVGFFWTNTYDGLYIPLTYTFWNGIKHLSETKDQRGVTQLQPFWFHFSNVLLHIGNVILIFLILTILFKNDVSALLGALVFAVHPLQVEAVTWVSEFRGLLSTFLGLITIWQYVLYRSRQAEGSASLHLIVAIITFVCSLLSKPSAIVVPVIIFILDYFFFKKSIKESLLPLSIGILLAIPVAIVTKAAQPASNLNFIAPIWSRPLLMVDSLGFYFQNLILPLKLSASYGRTPQFLIDNIYLALIGSVPLAILIFLIRKKEKYSVYLAAFLIFAIGFLPVSGILHFNFQKFSTVADRFVYFSMFGAAMAVAFSIKKYRGKIILVLTATVILIYSFLSYYQAKIWQNEFTLWNDTIQKYPLQAEPYNNRGDVYMKQGKLPKAIEDFSTAIQFNPEHESAYMNRGNAFAQLKQYNKAFDDYKKAIELKPDYAKAYFNRGVAYYYSGNINAAYQDLKKAESLGHPIPPQVWQGFKKLQNNRQ